jgi:hypothetical protein
MLLDRVAAHACRTGHERRTAACASEHRIRSVAAGTRRCLLEQYRDQYGPDITVRRIRLLQRIIRVDGAVDGPQVRLTRPPLSVRP